MSVNSKHPPDVLAPITTRRFRQTANLAQVPVKVSHLPVYESNLDLRRKRTHLALPQKNQQMMQSRPYISYTDSGWRGTLTSRQMHLTEPCDQFFAYLPHKIMLACHPASEVGDHTRVVSNTVDRISFPSQNNWRMGVKLCGVYSPQPCDYDLFYERYYVS